MRDLDIHTELGRRPERSHLEPSGPMTAMGIVTSVLLHGAVAGLVIWGTMSGGKDVQDRIKPKMLEFHKVELLALGEKKPPKALPRLANPAPPKVHEDAVNLAKPKKQPEPKQKPEEKKKPDKPPEKKPDKNKLLEQLQQLNDPDRPTNSDTPEGSKQGVAGGSSHDPKTANLMKTYGAKLMATLQRYWRVPTTLGQAEIKKLAGTVVVYVRLSESGHVVTYQFRSKSSNRQFNDSIDDLIRKFEVSGGRKLPMPDDPQVKQLIVQDGLTLDHWNAAVGH